MTQMDSRRPIEEYIQFLRYCLDEKLELPESAKRIDWRRMMVWAEQQAIVGIIYGGIQRADKSLGIPFDVLMEWIGYAQNIELRNRLLNRKVGEISERFRQDGFRNCILKGQGAALYYPNPLLRTPGDIDIWLEGGRDRIMGYVTGKYGRLLERYHHVELPVEDSIDIEVHFTPSYMFAPMSNRRMQRWFGEHAEAQFENRVGLSECEKEVAVPTAGFNAVFLLSHIYRHLFSEGIGLKQIIDYYYLLKGHTDFTDDTDERPMAARGHTEITEITERRSMAEMGRVLEQLGLMRFAEALMWVLHVQLGLDWKYLIAEPDEKEGRFLWSEIMIGGNFGQYDTRLGNKCNEGRVKKYVRMSVRNLRFVGHYPSEALSEPLFRAWHFLWRKIHGLE